MKAANDNITILRASLAATPKAKSLKKKDDIIT